MHKDSLTSYSPCVSPPPSCLMYVQRVKHESIIYQVFKWSFMAQFCWCCRLWERKICCENFEGKKSLRIEAIFGLLVTFTQQSLFVLLCGTGLAIKPSYQEMEGSGAKTLLNSSRVCAQTPFCISFLGFKGIRVCLRQGRPALSGHICSMPDTTVIISYSLTLCWSPLTTWASRSKNHTQCRFWIKHKKTK